MEALKRAEAGLVRVEQWLLAALLLVMVVMSFGQVLLRQLFATGVLWADTVLRHLVLWVGFLGAALASVEGKHFAWESPSHHEGRRADMQRLAACTATALISGFLLKASWQFFSEDREAGDILFTAGSLNVPAWLFSAIIPAGFALILLHTLIRTADAAARLKR